VLSLTPDFTGKPTGNKLFPYKKGRQQMIKKHNFTEQFTVLVMKSIFFLLLLLLPVRTYALGVGEKAPNFHLVTIQGKEISYDRDIKGKKPVYLFFWTTW
jgi:hypothetical protein